MFAGTSAVSNYLDRLMGGNNGAVPGAAERTPLGLGAKFLTHSKDLGAKSDVPTPTWVGKAMQDFRGRQLRQEGLHPQADIAYHNAQQQQNQQRYAESFLMGGVPQVPPARPPGSQDAAAWGARTRANIDRQEHNRGQAARQQNVPVSSKFLQGAYGRGYHGPSDRSLGRPIKSQGNSAVPKSPYKDPLGG